MLAAHPHNFPKHFTVRNLHLMNMLFACVCHSAYSAGDTPFIRLCISFTSAMSTYLSFEDVLGIELQEVFWEGASPLHDPTERHCARQRDPPHPTCPPPVADSHAPPPNGSGRWLRLHGRICTPAQKIIARRYLRKVKGSASLRDKLSLAGTVSHTLTSATVIWCVHFCDEYTWPN